MKNHRLLSVAALLATALLLTSCSKSVKDDDSSAGKKGGATSSTEPTTRTTRGVTDTSVKVGGITYGLYFGDASLGVQARLKKANDAGGVNGRKIDFVGVEENNNNEDSADQDRVKALVEQKEVFALLPVMTGGFGGGDYVAEHNVPMFGWGVNPAFCEGTVAFGITGCVTNPSLKVGSNALGTALKDMFNGDTNKTVAFIAEDNAAGKGGLVLLQNSVENVGFKVVYAEASLPAPPEQPGDISPFVNALLTSNGGKAPDIIYIQATLAGTKISNGLQTGGFKGMIITPSYSPLLLGQPGYDGIYINTQLGMDPSIPANAEMMDAVHAIKPDQQMSLALNAGYYAADFFIKALEATGKDLTVEKFLQTLNGGFTYSVDGVVGKSEWPQNHEKPVPCSVMTKVENKKFDYIQKLVCGTNIEIK